MRARAQMYSQIRQFFAEREVLEVETPIYLGWCDRCAFGFGSSTAPSTRQATNAIICRPHLSLP